MANTKRETEEKTVRKVGKLKMFKLDNDLCICMKHHRKIDYSVS